MVSATIGNRSELRTPTNLAGIKPALAQPAPNVIGFRATNLNCYVGLMDLDVAARQHTVGRIAAAEHD